MLELILGAFAAQIDIYAHTACRADEKSVKIPVEITCIQLLAIAFKCLRNSKRKRKRIRERIRSNVRARELLKTRLKMLKTALIDKSEILCYNKAKQDTSAKGEVLCR